MTRFQKPIAPTNFNENEVDVLAFGTPPKKKNRSKQKVQNSNG
jgi:hypothetical protein